MKNTFKLIGAVIAASVIFSMALSLTACGGDDPPPPVDAVVNIAAIAGVTAPVTGAAPVTAITETAQYTGSIVWNGAPAEFAAFTAYTATITLTAKSGYTLQGVGANFFTVAGATATNQANSGVITAVFPATGAAPIAMVFVPGGSFQMGYTKDGNYSNEVPVHQVTLSGFYMAKYQVTQEQYLAVTGTNPSYFTTDNDEPPETGETDAKRPVEQVSWYDAVEFCNKLSALEGRAQYYNITDRTPASEYPITSATVTENTGANGYRLPTEAQWEYAAKGGNGTPGNYTYSGSDTSGDVAWHTINSGGKTHEVGKKAANGLGLYDMSGNVYEWCWDWYDAYTSEAQTDPAGASSGSDRVMRGGCFNGQVVISRSVYRSRGFPSYWRENIGFRLALPQ
jgi:formylglycine-generating enzyme required for sulfatase activity